MGWHRMVFLNVGWMDRYLGLAGDRIRGGGSFVEAKGYGHEIYNFKHFSGWCYGYVQTPTGTINLERIDPTAKGDSLRGVLVIWVARHPKRGRCIVGWYKNATVHREFWRLNRSEGRIFRGKDVGYLVEARAGDCELLPDLKRCFSIPSGRGGMGQANVWYADHFGQERIRQKVLKYVRTGQLAHRLNSKPKSGGSIRRQVDPALRAKVERAAMRIVVRRFKGDGFDVLPVHKDNLGWDLEATRGNEKYRLEVKGLSGRQAIVELTPNEYAQMKAHQAEWRLCVVTNALARKSRLSIFAYSKDSGRWEDEGGNHLKIGEVQSAKCWV
ncbi:MAG: DUF3883 domain-containing protein [Planctomycetes bacterium]|nr:DUF3883 domain-containing protein [Planctomycetota bacterium]